MPETLHLLSTLPFPSVLIDATSSQALADAYPSLLQRGISVVTPNKKAFSGALSLWHGVQEARRRPGAPERGMLYHEATVGAGLPVVSTLTDLLATGDTVRRIEGVFSGTLSYLFNNFAPATASVSSGDAKNANPSWSACVASAKAAGYTEPDPRDDLNGMDVARKVVILARLAGMEVEGTESFPVQSLIPEELGGVGSGEEFMARLHECDAGMEEVREGAAREGMVVRYVGRVDVAGGALRVGVERVGRGHALAGLEGSDNVVGFWTERYGERPLVVQGAG